jgi:hypothetical protein
MRLSAEGGAPDNRSNEGAERNSKRSNRAIWFAVGGIARAVVVIWGLGEAMAPSPAPPPKETPKPDASPLHRQPIDLCEANEL